MVFFGGFKGQVRWPEGPPHLALNPPFWFLFFGCFCLFVCFCVFLGGFQGQVKWPKGPPHSALNPPFLFSFFFFFPFFAFNRNIFSLKRAFLLIIECLPLFLLSLFWPPPFSLPLSLSLSCYFLSSFLRLSLFAFFWSFFVSFFHFLSSLVLFHEKNQHETLKFESFFINPFSFWFPVLFSLSNAFFLSLLFPDFDWL